MTAIELIRAEVERLMDEYKPTVGGVDELTGSHIILAKLLSFLDTLQEPKVDDIFKKWGTTEEEYLAKSMDKVRLEMEIATYLKDWEDDEEIGLHLSTDNGCITIELEDVRDLARHFAKWQKERMLKEAVEGTLGYGPHLQRPIIMLESVPDIWDGGCKQVRVIVLKEEEQ